MQGLRWMAAELKFDRCVFIELACLDYRQTFRTQRAEPRLIDAFEKGRCPVERGRAECLQRCAGVNDTQVIRLVRQLDVTPIRFLPACVQRLGKVGGGAAGRKRMRRRETATHAIHQLTQFALPDLRFELFRQRSEQAAPLRGNLALQQVVDGRDLDFRKG